MASSSRRPSGKRPRESSGASLPVSAVSLVPPARVEIFNKDIGKRGVVQQHAFYRLEAERMHLPEVLSLLQHQGLINFLECNTQYSEDLVRVFYSGLHENFRGHKLSSKVGSTKVSVKSNFWNKYFDLSVDDAGNPLPEVTDSHHIDGYEFKRALNDMLVRPYSDDFVQSDLFPRTVTAGKLSAGERILQWIVSRILRPKKGGLSRVEQSEVHLIYILKNKIKINWPYYIASRMYNLRNSGRGTALAYGSFIQEVLTTANVSHPSFPLTSITPDKEFSTKTMSMMGYIWCKERKKYKFVRRGYVPPRADSDESEEQDDEVENEEEEEDEEEEARHDNAHNGGDDSPSPIGTYDYSGSAWVQQPDTYEEAVPRWGGWGEWQHTGWTTRRESYQPYHHPEEEFLPSPPHLVDSSELLEMMQSMQLAQQTFMESQDDRLAQITSQLQTQNERIENLSTSLNERYVDLDRQVTGSLRHLEGVCDYLETLADPSRNPGVCYHPGHRHLRQ
jgi:hypothetical protein